MIAVERVEQPVLQHRVDELHIAHLDAVAQMRGVGRHRHRFLSAGDDDAGVAVDDLLQAERDGAQAAAAQLVEAESGLFLGNAGFHRGLTRGILALRGGQNLSENDFVDIGGLDARGFERGFYRRGAQFVRRRIGEGAVERTDGGSLRAGDDDFRYRHGVLPWETTRAPKLASTPLASPFLYTNAAGRRQCTKE